MKSFDIKNNISLYALVLILSSGFKDKTMLLCHMSDETYCLTYEDIAGYIIYDPKISKIIESHEQFLSVIKEYK